MPISTEKIEIALGQHLAAMTGAPTIAYQNQDIDPARPFLAADHVPGTRTDPTLDGTGETVRGQYMVYVVVTAGDFTTAANTLADKILDRFKYKTLISMTSGAILVVKPPEVLTGYKDGADWRVPVRIDYEVQI